MLNSPRLLDIHNHVLFGIDDGCRTLSESLEMAEAAKEAGHRGFVATPHIRLGMFDNTVEGIKKRRDETLEVVRGAGLELHLGAEYYFDEQLLSHARKKTVLTLGETSRFVLTELPAAAFPQRYQEVLFEIRVSGYVPVIAHPERCSAVARDLDGALEAFDRANALMQLDIGSLIGRYGRSAKKAGIELVKRGAYHVVACDLHRPADVKMLKKAYKELNALLKKRGTPDQLKTLIDINPQKLIDDAPLDDITRA